MEEHLNKTLKWAGLESEQPQYLGGASSGSAYKVGKYVVKLTTSSAEARLATRIVKVRHRNLYTVLQVGKIRLDRYMPSSRGNCVKNLYVILYEYLQPATKEMQRAASWFIRMDPEEFESEALRYLKDFPQEDKKSLISYWFRNASLALGSDVIHGWHTDPDTFLKSGVFKHAKALLEVYKWTKDKGITLVDIYGGNVCRRGQDIVVIDPIGGATKTRFKVEDIA